MGEFEKKFNEIIEEESRVVQKRTYYPRKVKTAGGFSQVFLDCLADEVKRLNEIDESITIQHILKSLDFEVTKRKSPKPERGSEA